MKFFHFFIVVAAVFSLSPAFAAKFQIKNISIDTMTPAHLCHNLGGQDKNPTVTLTHSKIAGQTIKVSMFDTVSNGSFINHRSTTVKSDPSGKTTLTFDFLAPCNTTGDSISTYKVQAKVRGSKKTVVWGKYNSRSKRIRN